MTYVIAHRGSSQAERANTIAAYRRAVSDGADAIELDVRRSADGVLVCRQDARLPGGRVLAETVAADLPSSIPALADALDACRGVWVNIEIKNDERDPDFDPDDAVAREVLEVLADRDEAADNWLLSCFRLATVDRCRELAPQFATALVTLGVDAHVPAMLVERGHVAVHPWAGKVDTALVARCQDAGLRVNAWTCNDAERFAELAAWGVDGICTDLPDIMVSVLGRPTPA